MRTIFTSLISLLAVAVMAPATAAGSVDLDDPAALARVARDNPAHARSIEQILRRAPSLTPWHLAQWMKTSFDAVFVSTNLLKTSDPPQSRLWFKLGDTEYKATVTFESVGALHVPAD